MGCGLVEFTNDEDAKKAISTLNESAFKGRNIKVKEVNHYINIARDRHLHLFHEMIHSSLILNM